MQQKHLSRKFCIPTIIGETNTDEIVMLLKDSGIEVRIRSLK